LKRTRRAERGSLEPKESRRDVEEELRRRRDLVAGVARVAVDRDWTKFAEGFVFVDV
jgi:hypothetical protein